MFGEGMLHRAHSLGSVSRPTVDEMQPRPILDEYRKREAATPALCPFGPRPLLPRPPAPGAAGPPLQLASRRRDAADNAPPPFWGFGGLLKKLGPPAAGCRAHSKPALRSIENQPVLPTPVDA